MAAWAADFRNCVIDPDTGALGPCGKKTRFAASRAAVAPGGELAIVQVHGLLRAFRVDASGRIEDAGATPQAVEGGWAGVVMHPLRPIVYTGGNAFHYTADGDLTPVTGSPFPIAARALLFRPDGAFAYAVGSETDERSLAVYRVETSGALTEVANYSSGPVQVEEPGRGDVVIDRTGGYLVTRDVAVYRIDGTTGTLKRVFRDPHEAVTLVAHPQKNLIFRARDDGGEYSRVLDTMRLDLQSGALSVVSTVPMLPRHHGGYTRLVIETQSRSLYHVTTHGIDEGMSIVRYAIDAKGALSPPYGSDVLSGENFQSDFVTFRGPRNPQSP